MNRIIVPTDFSEQSEYALKTAASLAEKLKCKIYALHMLELNQSLTTSAEGFHPEYSVFLIKTAEKRMKEYLNKPYMKDIEVEPIIKHYKVFSEINEIAQKHKVDLIVMGSHGANGLKEMFIGSNAEKVVRTSDVPVMVVKNFVPDYGVKRMVFACDFKSENLEVYKKAKAFADLLEAEFELVYINTPGDSFLSTADAYKKINRFYAEAGFGQEMDIYNDYSVERGILNFAESTNADLIRLPTHGRRGLSHFFMGSIGEDIVNHSKIPVVTFKIS